MGDAIFLGILGNSQNLPGCSGDWAHRGPWWFFWWPDECLWFLSHSLNTLVKTRTFMNYVPSGDKILIELSQHTLKIISWGWLVKTKDQKVFSASSSLAYIRQLTWMAPPSLSNFVAVWYCRKCWCQTSQSPGLSKAKLDGGWNLAMSSL